MKRMIALLLCTLIIIPAGLTGAMAASADIETVQEVVYTLGAFTPGKDLSSGVTRAELAKVLVSVSAQRTAVPSKSTTSPYKDVKFNHWAAPYVKLAVSSGYMSAYPDGTFKPDQIVKVEDAVTGLLKVLGYASSDYGIDFPYGPMSYAAGKDFEMLDGVSAGTGGTLVRRDFMRLVYNALDCPMKSGQGMTLLNSLGHTRVNAGSPLDIESVDPDTLDGPVTVLPGGDWAGTLGITTGDYTVYRNDAKASATDLARYDVVYYSKRQNAVYAYARSVAGILQEVAPSRQAPATVTVGGVTYSLEGEPAQKAVNLSGQLRTGDAVLLLLGVNNKVADIQPLSDTGSQYGFVVDAGRKEFVLETGGKVQSYFAVISTNSGDKLEYRTTNDASSLKGMVVSISFKDGLASIGNTKLVSSLSGTVDAAAGTVGKTKLAPGLSIVEIVDGTVYPVALERLDGMQGSFLKTLFYTTNTRGQIENLYLSNTTGDHMQYGLVTGVTNVTGDMSASSTISYNIAGNRSSFTISNRTVNYKNGPSVFETKNGQPVKASALYTMGEVTLELTQVRTIYGAAFPIEDNVLIYDRTNKDTLITVEQARNMGDDVKLTAYYDKVVNEGGRVRIILVETR